MQAQGDITNLPIHPQIQIKNGVAVEYTPADYLVDFPRTIGTVTATVSGTVTDADTATVTISHAMLPNGSKAFQATASSDSLTTMAQQIVNAINNDADMRKFGIFATSLAGVITISWKGPLSKKAVITVAKTGTIVIARGNSGLMAGGGGPIEPFKSFQYVWHGYTLSFTAGMPESVGDDLLAVLIADNVPIG